MRTNLLICCLSSFLLAETATAQEIMPPPKAPESCSADLAKPNLHTLFSPDEGDATFGQSAMTVKADPLVTGSTASTLKPHAH